MSDETVQEEKVEAETQTDETKVETTSDDPFKGTPFEGVKVPDKFVKEGKVQVGDLVKSYSEVERMQFKRRDEIAAEISSKQAADRDAAAPRAPADYTVEEKFVMGDREVTIIKDDPLLDFMKNVAFELRMPQDKFNETVRGYAAAAIAAQPAWSNEAAKLGSLAEQRHTRVDGFMRGSLSKEAYSEFAAMPATASRIKAFEEMMVLAGHPPMSLDSGDMPGETYTREQLKTMQRDPRYTGEGGQIDKVFVQTVRNGFKRLAA